MGYLKERISYIRGLADGMGLDATTKEGKILTEIMRFLDELTETVSENADDIESLNDEIEEIQESVDLLESSVYFDEDDDDYDFMSKDEEDDEDYLEVKCSKCGDVIYFDPSVFESGEDVTCPSCNSPIVLSEDDEL